MSRRGKASASRFPVSQALCSPLLGSALPSVLRHWLPALAKPSSHTWPRGHPRSRLPCPSASAANHISLLALCFPLALRGLDILTSSLKWGLPSPTSSPHRSHMPFFLHVYRATTSNTPSHLPSRFAFYSFHENADPSVACRKPESQAVEEVQLICVAQAALPIASNLGTAQ